MAQKNTREHLVKHLDKKTARKYGKLSNLCYSFTSLERADPGAISLLSKELYLLPEQLADDKGYTQLDFGDSFVVDEDAAKEIASLKVSHQLGVYNCTKEAAFILMEANSNKLALAPLDDNIFLRFSMAPLHEIIGEAVSKGLEDDLVHLLYNKARDTAIISTDFKIADLEYKSPTLLAAVIRIAYPNIVVSNGYAPARGNPNLLEASINSDDFRYVFNYLTKTNPDVIAEALWLLVTNYTKYTVSSGVTKRVSAVCSELELYNILHDSDIRVKGYDRGKTVLNRVDNVKRIIPFLKRINQLMEHRDNAMIGSYLNNSTHLDVFLKIEKGSIPYPDDVLNDIIAESRSVIYITGPQRACQNAGEMLDPKITVSSTVRLKNLNIVKNNSLDISVPVYIEAVDTEGIHDAGLSNNLKGLVETILIAPTFKVPRINMTYKEYTEQTLNKQIKKLDDSALCSNGSTPYGRRLILKLAQGIPVKYDDINPILEAIEAVEYLVPGYVTDIPLYSSINDANSYDLVKNFFTEHTSMSEDAICNLTKAVLLPGISGYSNLTYNTRTRVRLAKYIIESTAGSLIKLMIPSTCLVSKRLVTRIKQFNERPVCSYAPAVRHRYVFRQSTLAYSGIREYNCPYRYKGWTNKAIAASEHKAHITYYNNGGLSDITVPFAGYDKNGNPVLNIMGYLDAFKDTENSNCVDIEIRGHNMCKYGAPFTEGVYLALITEVDGSRASSFKGLTKAALAPT